MNTKSIFSGLFASSLCLFSVSTTAAVVNEAGDFDSQLPILLDQGFNSISGSLSTTCIASSGSFADCSAGNGDQVDNIFLTLPTGFEIASASLTITNFTTTGNLALFNNLLATGRLRFADDEFGGFLSIIGEFKDNGTPTLNLKDSVKTAGLIQFSVNSATSSSFGQGTGDFSYDYELTLNTAPSPVPLPAAAWLFLSGIGGLAGLRLKNK